MKNIKKYNIDIGSMSLTVSDEGAATLEKNRGNLDTDYSFIGYDSLGDPIIHNSQNDKVFTSTHGEGDWKLNEIAPSIGIFYQILERVSNLSRGRENPFLLESNPITATEHDDFFSFLHAHNFTAFGLSYWQGWIDNI